MVRRLKDLFHKQEPLTRSQQAWEQAAAVGRQAKDQMDQAIVWASPRVERAIASTAQAVVPRVEAATEAVKPYVEQAQARIKDDYWPRVNQAMQQAQEAAAQDGTMLQKAEAASKAARDAWLEKPQPKPSAWRRLGKVVAIVGAVAGALAVAAFAWRKMEPATDPWAEEYWENVGPVDEEWDEDLQSGGEEQAADMAAASMEAPVADTDPVEEDLPEDPQAEDPAE